MFALGKVGMYQVVYKSSVWKCIYPITLSDESSVEIHPAVSARTIFFLQQMLSFRTAFVHHVAFYELRMFIPMFFLLLLRFVAGQIIDVAKVTSCDPGTLITWHHTAESHH